MKINKRRGECAHLKCGAEMSLGSGLRNMSGVQEILVLALMLVSVFAIFYSDLEPAFKIGIAALAFSIIFLATLANQILEQEKEKRHN